MQRATIALLGGLLLLITNGCAMLELVDTRDFTGFKQQLTDTQKRYTRSMRWNEFTLASQVVAPESRSAYLKALDALGPIRITDYETAAPDYDAEALTATVVVRYAAYHEDTMQTVTLVEEQRWKRDLESGDWRLDHEGPPLVESKAVGAR